MDCLARLLRAIIIWSLRASFSIFGCFSAFSVGSIHQKNVTAVKFSPQRYLKVLPSGIVIAYLTLPVMKELKMKTTTKLSFMMFVEWFIWGAWFVPLWLWLSKSGFSAGEIGWSYACTAIAAILSPILVGSITDRFSRRRKCWRY